MYRFSSPHTAIAAHAHASQRSVWASGAETKGYAFRSSIEPAAECPLTCFLVEDSPVIRENLIATLEEMLPLKVVGTAEDEEGALRWLRGPQAECDLVIIDIFLKTGSGLGVLRDVRSQFPERRLIVLSNYATPDMRRRCHELGADRVFDKSSELDELLSYCETLSPHAP